MRIGGSKLAERLPLVAARFFGIEGIGGALRSGDAALADAFLPGEGDLNVRSVMEELLSRLTIPLPAPPLPVIMLLLAMDDCDPLRIMRLV